MVTAVTAKTFDPEDFEEVSREALLAQSVYIREAILGDVDISKYFVKGDKTAVTIIDTGSRDRGKPFLRLGLPGFRRRGEESEGVSGDLSATVINYNLWTAQADF